MAGTTGKRNPESYFNDTVQEHHEIQSENNACQHTGDFPSPLGLASNVRCLQTRFNDGVLKVGESSNRNQINSQGETPRLGLALKMSTSEINRLELALSQESHQNGHHKLRVSKQHHSFKACNIPALSLKIGNWEWESKHEGVLVAKFYYRTKKLVWEVLYCHLKKKIEIQWSHISAINTYTNGINTSRLEIQMQLNPKMRTKWENIGNDFTGGQTCICSQHTIIFARRVLDGPFSKILECDKHLSNLTQQLFPYENPPLFQHQILDFSPNKSIRECSPIIPNNIHQQTIAPCGPTLDRRACSFVGYSSSNLPKQVWDSPSMDQSRNNRSPDIKQDDFSCNKSVDGCSSINPNNSHQETIVPYAPNLDQPVSSFIGHASSNLPLPMPVLKSSSTDQSINNPIPEIPFAVIQDEQDDFLPNHKMDFGILDDQLLPELLELDMMNDAEPCKPIHPSYEMTRTAKDYKDELPFKEHNSCLPIEARIGMDDFSNELKNTSSYVDDNIFGVCDPLDFQEPNSWLNPEFSMHEFNINGGNDVNQMGVAADDELFVFQNSIM